MAAALDPTLFVELSRLIAERMGLHFPEDRWPDLARGIESAGRELGCESPERFVSRLRAGTLTVEQMEELASHLTVGETYFYRDPKSFEAVEREILPSLVARRAGAGRTLRLWSAGCCTGEEAYSLAIACTRVLPDHRSWKLAILATDINRKFLAKAEAGVYSQWSFRGVSESVRKQFFARLPDKKFAIDPALKKLVQFAYLNLAEDVFPALHNQTNAMDVIFCRNVLMYFTPEHQRRVVAALHRCLVDGGYLLVNPAEANASLFPMFESENRGGAQWYRKTSERRRSAPPPRYEVPSPVEPIAEWKPVTVETPSPPAPRTEPVAVTAARSPLEIARDWADQGKLEQALASCQEAIAADRTDCSAYFLAATICQELGRLEDAVSALGKVLYLDQDFILAHYALGGLYKRMAKDKESRRHLAIALELLSDRRREDIVPDSDGMTCGRLVESVRALGGI